jgi:hypothetical protein
MLAVPAEQSMGLVSETVTPPLPRKVQVVAFCTLAVIVVVPPRPVNALVGDAEYLMDTTGAGSVMMALAALLVVPAVATSVKENRTALDEKFAGNVTFAFTAPSRHELVIGSPEEGRAGSIERVHVAALVTTPDRLTVPPLKLNGPDGEALNEMINGDGVVAEAGTVSPRTGVPMSATAIMTLANNFIIPPRSIPYCGTR